MSKRRITPKHQRKFKNRPVKDGKPTDADFYIPILAKMSKKTLQRRIEHARYLDRLAAADLTPMSVMGENMAYAHVRAQLLTAQVMEALETYPPANNDEAYRKWVKSMVEGLRDGQFFREFAQKCAVELAPYTHPKLVAIHHTVPDPDGPANIVDVHFLPSGSFGTAEGAAKSMRDLVRVAEDANVEEDWKEAAE